MHRGSLTAAVLTLTLTASLTACPSSPQPQPQPQPQPPSTYPSDARLGVEGGASTRGDDAAMAIEDAAVPTPISRVPLPGSRTERDAASFRCHLAGDGGGPAAKGRFVSVVRHPAFEADRIGGDGGLDPDGHQDVVIDVEFDGAVIAFSMASAFASMEASTGWGDLETYPRSPVPPQKHVATLIAFDEKNTALNARDTSFALGEGRHRLKLRVSGYYVTPQTPWRIFALRPDCTLIEGPSLK